MNIQRIELIEGEEFVISNGFRTDIVVGATLAQIKSDNLEQTTMLVPPGTSLGVRTAFVYIRILDTVNGRE